MFSPHTQKLYLYEVLNVLHFLSHFSHVQLFATLQTAACQAPLSMGILQARIVEWVAMLSSTVSSQPRNRTWVFCIVGRFFTI